jgi:hypothetical protein
MGLQRLHKKKPFVRQQFTCNFYKVTKGYRRGYTQFFIKPSVTADVTSRNRYEVTAKSLLIKDFHDL